MIYNLSIFVSSFKFTFLQSLDGCLSPSQAPEPDTVSGKVPCGSWRTRYELASHLLGLAECLIEPTGSEGKDGRAGDVASSVLLVVDCACTLVQDPVCSVRREASKQLEALRALGY
jgi:hypothetical protein